MDFKLPDIGEGVHEGEITRWLIKEGDKIEADQPMVEVMTDKATVEIPSPITGVIEKLMAKEGETILVGATLLTIRENGKAAPAPQVAKESPKAAAPQAHSAPPSRAASSSSGMQHVEAEEIPFHVLATPATRKLARDLQMEVAKIPGTGPKGRITKMDVQLAYESEQASKVRPSHPTPSVTPAIHAPSHAASSQGSSQMVPHVPVVARGAVERIPLKGIRKRIAEAMSISKRNAAHFTYVEEVDMTEVVKLRSGAKPEAEKQGVKLTFLPFVIKALVPTLREFPMFNSSLDEEKQEIVIKGDYNIGVATDTPQGLIVPVIKGADQKSLWQIAAEISVLAEKARNNKLAIDDLKGGTFTITNAGSIGGVLATPIINYPEVAILGVNAIRKRPVVLDDQIVIRDIMYLSISVDHRLVDGADAARFMNRLVFYLSDPKRLVFA